MVATQVEGGYIASVLSLDITNLDMFENATFFRFWFAVTRRRHFSQLKRSFSKTLSEVSIFENRPTFFLLS